jgi:hypothetical protein
MIWMTVSLRSVVGARNSFSYFLLFASAHLTLSWEAYVSCVPLCDLCVYVCHHGRLCPVYMLLESRDVKLFLYLHTRFLQFPIEYSLAGCLDLGEKRS